MTDQLFSFNSRVLPAPSLTDDPTPVIQLVDPVLYTLANFFAQILESNLQPRFSNEAMHSGMSNNGLNNWIDGYTVAQITDFPLHDLTLKGNSFKFPHLNVVIEARRTLPTQPDQLRSSQRFLRLLDPSSNG